jgi:hypothetical protein
MTPTQMDLDSANPRESGWRDGNWLIFAELAVVAAIFLADQHRLISFSKTPYLLLLAWISLRVRKVSWRQVDGREQKRESASEGEGTVTHRISFVKTACLRRLTEENPRRGWLVKN